MRHGVRWGGVVLLMAMAIGCTRAPTGAQREKDEAVVRERFTALQDAFKAVQAKPDDANTRKLFDLLHTDSQQNADRAAKSVSDQYVRADDAAKAKISAALGVSGADFQRLSGIDYLRSKVFLNTYQAVADSKLDKITFERDKAWAHYQETGSARDSGKVEFALQDQQWKIILPIPPMPEIGAK
jgi:hypothetical protein